MCRNTSATRCSTRTRSRAASISSRRSALKAAASGSASPPGGAGKYGISSPPYSRPSRRDSFWRTLKQVFTVILYNQVLNALSPLKPLMFLQTLIQTSWLASWASSLPSTRRATLYTRLELARTSFEKASTSPREARATRSRSSTFKGGRLPRRSQVQIVPLAFPYPGKITETLRGEAYPRTEVQRPETPQKASRPL